MKKTASVLGAAAATAMIAAPVAATERFSAPIANESGMGGENSMNTVYALALAAIIGIIVYVAVDNDDDDRPTSP